MNPYLMLAAVLGAALIGIEDGLTPPPPITGNAYALDLPQVPANWADAIDAFEAQPDDRAHLPAGTDPQPVLTKRQELHYMAELSPRGGGRALPRHGLTPCGRLACPVGVLDQTNLTDPMLIGILQTGQAPAELRERTGDYPSHVRAILAATASTSNLHVVVSATASMRITPSSRRWKPFIRKMPMPRMCRWSASASVTRSSRRRWAAGSRSSTGGWAVGPQHYDFGGTPFTLNAWHQDQVIEPPDGATVIASQ
jgi:hypothetical protein